MHTYKEYHLATTTVYTQSEEEANDLIGTLKGPLGSLVDWPVFFWPDGGPTNQRTNLVQLCDEQTVLLIHVGQMIELPKKLSEILENPDIPKIGVNVLKNGEKLFDDFGVACANLIELGALAQHAVHQFNISPSFLFEKQVVSLEEMTARFQAGTLAKLKRRALNWIRPQLSEEQIGCVANNTYSALMVYKKLLQIAHNKKQRLEPAETSFDIEREPTDVLTSSSRTAPGNGVLPLGETTSALVPRRQMRAYILWHVLDMSLNEICAELRSRENPLAYSTVVSYILGALRADPDLPFDIRRLETLVRYDPYCWKKYKKWFWRIWFEQRDKRAAERDG
ncbi:hypothetical protein CERSUDRAFT_95429 [Gelatoporia subvermispora B]|uniref:3'-5' exonuclease domain-containing protein n=1 Tax=Ceriporiopsis subvermispora (strain B) TaxID=914234 RepID=M2QJE1_CERS8|nr:hypothetical protein CERSUDRAFT_95429 [Gelatoporia subvermispora B]